MRYPRGSGTGVTPGTDLDVLPVGRGEVLRSGKEVALLAFGSMVSAASKAAEELDATVANMRFVKPLDEALVRKNIQSLAAEVAGSPAVIGFMLQDEPHARAMPSLALVAKIIQELMSGKWPYVNLFPVRVSPERMGVPSYDAYVRMLVDMIHQPFLSYDNYSLVKGEMLDWFYVNLEVVRRLSVQTGAPLWNCVLSNAHFNYMENTARPRPQPKLEMRFPATLGERRSRVDNHCPKMMALHSLFMHSCFAKNWNGSKPWSVF